MPPQPLTRSTPRKGVGAAGLTAAAERALAPVERLAPELQKAGDELRDAELRLRETASALRSFLTVLEADPDRVEQVEAELERMAEARRRFRCASFDELLARAADAKAELGALEEGSTRPRPPGGRSAAPRAASGSWRGLQHGPRRLPPARSPRPLPPS